MNRDTIENWLKQLNLDYVVLKEPPPSYEYAMAIKQSHVIILRHKNTGIVEMQYTTKFNDDVTKRFFALNETPRNEIVCSLRELLLGLDVRHNIIVNDRQSFFGFSLMAYLPESLSKTDLLDRYHRILEIRDLVGQRIIPLMDGGSRTTPHT